VSRSLVRNPVNLPCIAAMIGSSQIVCPSLHRQRCLLVPGRSSSSTSRSICAAATLRKIGNNPQRSYVFDVNLQRLCTSDFTPNRHIGPVEVSPPQPGTCVHCQASPQDCSSSRRTYSTAGAAPTFFCVLLHPVFALQAPAVSMPATLACISCCTAAQEPSAPALDF
jgi:hypothetical protein